MSQITSSPSTPNQPSRWPDMQQLREALPSSMTGKLAVGAGATFALGAVYTLATKQWDSKRTTAQCSCGAVQLDICVPLSSRVVDQPSIACHCPDCVGFCEFVRSRQGIDFVDEKHGSVQMIQFFKSDVRLVKGEDQVQVCKLRKDSPLYRYFARCCGTPLALMPATSALPIVVIYARIIAHPEIFPPMSTAVGFASSRSGTVKHDVPTYESMFAPAFMLRAISRVFYGGVIGKGWSRPFAGVDDSTPLVVSDA